MRSASRGPVGPTLALPGRLYGVRQWSARFRADGRAILSGYQDSPWRSGGESTWAVCKARGHEERSPAGWCTCGLYAFHPLGSWARSLVVPKLADTPWVVGFIEAHGKIHVHREGFRAQYARPVGFLLIGDPRWRYRTFVEKVAEHHAAPVIALRDYDEYVDYCERLGLGLRDATVARLLKTPFASPEAKPATQPSTPGASLIGDLFDLIGQVLAALGTLFVLGALVCLAEAISRWLGWVP